MNKIKIIHIHTDLKFINDSDRYEGIDIENTLIVIGKGNSYNGKYKDSINFYSLSLKNLNTIINKCKTVDIVVLYGLCKIKAHIANHTASNVMLIWRFFGLELYRSIPGYVFSEKSKEAKFDHNTVISNFNYNKILDSLINLIRFRTTFKGEFEMAAFKRVDYFHGLSEKEYSFLKEIWPKLPPFLQISYVPYTTIKRTTKPKNNLILLGNNRSPYNNHLDIINLIKRSNNKSQYKFLLVFNYGQITRYVERVRSKATEIPEITVLEEFLSGEKFTTLYDNADAFVMNGYRQMAMGNIWEAIRTNTKVYLNDKNIMFHWLREEGFFVFSVEDLISDLDKQAIQLTKSEALHNQQQLINFTQKYNKEGLHKSLKEMVSENKFLQYHHVE